jgi:hypothetical protein
VLENVQLSNAKKYAIVAIFMQRSTMVGIVGLLVTILSVVGVDMNQETELRVIEVFLLITSATAIAVQPKGKWDGRTDRRTDGAALDSGDGTGSEGEEG